MSISKIQIRPFQPTDQSAARRLILAGLAAHWGWLDPTLNADLDDIAAAYADGLFLVGERDGWIIATGALIPETAGVARIVRMSVAPAYRRQGIGRQLLDALCAAAAAQNVQQLVLETTSTWTDAVTFYQSYGFTVVGIANGDTHFALNVPIT